MCDKKEEEKEEMMIGAILYSKARKEQEREKELKELERVESLKGLLFFLLLHILILPTYNPLGSAPRELTHTQVKRNKKIKVHRLFFFPIFL